MFAANQEHRRVCKPSHPSHHHVPMEQLLVRKDKVAHFGPNVALNRCVHGLVLHLFAQLRVNCNQYIQCPGTHQLLPGSLLHHYRVSCCIWFVQRQVRVELPRLSGDYSWLLVSHHDSYMPRYRLLQHRELASEGLVRVLGARRLDSLLPLDPLCSHAQKCRVLECTNQDDSEKFRGDGSLLSHCHVRCLRIYQLLPSH